MRTVTRPEPQRAEPETPRRGPVWWIALLSALLVGLAALAFVVADGDGGGDQDRPTATTSPSDAEPTSSTSAPSDPGGVGTSALWPLPGSAARYTSPTDAARSFAVDYLRFRAPLIDPFQAGDARSGEVPVRPSPRGPVTTIAVRQLGADAAWYVLGAMTENIELTSPALDDEISSPVRVAGRALAFEGHVQVEVREGSAGGAIGAGFVTGGGDELRPFEGNVPFESSGTPTGALVLFTQSAENGEVWEAMAIRVRLRSTDIDALACEGFRPTRPTLGADQMEVKAYFNCDRAGGEIAPFPVYRAVPRSSGVLAASMGVLVGGPTDEERSNGVGSFFSSSTRGAIRSVTLEAGHAVIDFVDLRTMIPNASSSAGSAQLLSQLDVTAFQFPTVQSVEYRLLGSCEAFNEWLQFGGCDRRTRAEVSQD